MAGLLEELNGCMYLAEFLLWCAWYRIRDTALAAYQALERITSNGLVVMALILMAEIIGMAVFLDCVNRWEN